MKNLVWCSVDANKVPSELFSAEREFDTFLHNYGTTSFSDAKDSPQDGAPQRRLLRAKATGEEKLQVAAKHIPNLLEQYDQFAFLDDDLVFTAGDLNRLFMAGEALRLPLYQPALTRKSFSSHLHLREIPDAVVRKVSFVEIMCPFFSREALRACLPTFDLNLSGWGLDCYLWPKKVGGKTYVVDAIPIGHYNAPSRRDRVQRNGKTPAQECEELKKLCDSFS